MKHVGIDAFGLRDVICGEKDYVEHDPRPATVIVPDSPMGAMITGKRSTEERVHSGLVWPESARVDGESTRLRRVPVGLAWRMMVESREKAATWTSSEFSWPVAEILAAHICSLAVEAGYGDALSSREHDTRFVVAIPNQLDEYAQTALLYALQKRGMDATLLWRPVAAAMRWLSSLEGKEGLEGRNLLVAYFGADAMEMAAFQLKRVKGFLVPVRKRSRVRLTPGALDLALEYARTISPRCRADMGVLWQVAFRLPEVWLRLGEGRTDFDMEVVSTRDGWREWSPSFDSDPLDVQTKLDPCLQKFAGIERTGDGFKNCWREHILNRFDSLSANLCGCVLCGPLAGQLANVLESKMSLSSVVEPEMLYIASGKGLAVGCKLYSERLELDLPTYLDTLPRLEMYYQSSGNSKWRALIDSTEVSGGSYYRNSIDNTFFVPKGRNVLNMVLRKDSDKIASREEEIDEWDYKSAEVDFNEITTKNQTIDIKVEMRPASGLAKVTLIPVDRVFLDGRTVLFDFERMQSCNKPKEFLFYPEDGTRSVYAFGINWKDIHEVNCIIGWDNKIDKNIKELLENMTWISTRYQPKDKIGHYYFKINQDGETGDPEGDKYIDMLADKYSNLYKIFKNTENEVKFLVRASYLWKKTPDNIVSVIYEYVNSLLHNGEMEVERKNDIITAASRCFSSKEYCKCLFDAVVQGDLNKTTYFESCARMLHFNSNAKYALTDDIGYYFIEKTIDIAKGEVERGNIKRKFKNSAFLFLMALKQRANNDKFMNRKESKQAMKYFDEMNYILDQARKNESDKRIIDALNSIKKFMDYRGTPGLINIFPDVDKL